MHSADIRYLPTYQTGWTMVFEKWGWDARTPPPPRTIIAFYQRNIVVTSRFGPSSSSSSSSSSCSLPLREDVVDGLAYFLQVASYLANSIPIIFGLIASQNRQCKCQWVSRSATITWCRMMYCTE